jgi:hypothetical protein
MRVKWPSQTFKHLQEAIVVDDTHTHTKQQLFNLILA